MDVRKVPMCRGLPFPAGVRLSGSSLTALRLYTAVARNVCWL